MEKVEKTYRKNLKKNYNKNIWYGKYQVSTKSSIREQNLKHTSQVDPATLRKLNIIFKNTLHQLCNKDHAVD